MPKESKLVLLLEHEVYPHAEFWYRIQGSEDKIFAVSDTPLNYPNKSSHWMTIPEAMRQYALMTSTEGWYVGSEDGWHDMVEAYTLQENLDGALKDLERYSHLLDTVTNSGEETYKAFFDLETDDELAHAFYLTGYITGLLATQGEQL